MPQKSKTILVSLNRSFSPTTVESKLDSDEAVTLSSTRHGAI